MLLEIMALVDARGLPRESALARAKQVLFALERGSVAEILATETTVGEAIEAWAIEHGREVVERSDDGSVERIVVRRK